MPMFPMFFIELKKKKDIEALKNAFYGCVVDMISDMKYNFPYESYEGSQGEYTLELEGAYLMDYQYIPVHAWGRVELEVEIRHPELVRGDGYITPEVIVPGYVEASKILSMDVKFYNDTEVFQFIVDDEVWKED